MFVVLSSSQSHCESSTVYLTNVGQRQVAVDLQTKPSNLGCESTCRLQALHPSLQFIITQPES